MVDSWGNHFRGSAALDPLAIRRGCMTVSQIPLDTQVELEKGQTRAFTFIADLISFKVMLFGLTNTQLSETSNSIFACPAANMDLYIPMWTFAESPLTGIFPSSFYIYTKAKMPEPGGPSIHGVQSVSERLTCAVFSVFSERVCDWVRHNHSGDTKNWPPNINFGRVIRNAIVHGGKINSVNAKADPVSWRGLTFSPADNGAVAINAGKLSGGDLILLMLEMELELNALGAPFDISKS